MTHPERAERRKKISEAVKGGMPIGEAMTHFNVSHMTVRNAMAEGGNWIQGGLADPRKRAKRSDMAEAVRSGRDIDTVAKVFSAHRTTVIKACREFGVNPQLPGIAIVSKEMWEAVDWVNQRDVEISKIVGVTRERVRQMRNILGKPKSNNHRKSEGFIRFRDWVNQSGREFFEILTVTDISDLYPENQGHALNSWCRKLGIGRPSKSKVTRETLSDLCVHKKVRDDLSECWEWRDSSHQYGSINSNQANIEAFELFRGPRDKNLLIIHRCANRKCVNPDHLFQGTHKEAAAMRGKYDPHWNTPLTMEQVSDAKRRRLGGESIKSIAAHLQANYQTIWNLISGRSHKNDIPDEQSTTWQLRETMMKRESFCSRDLAELCGVATTTASAAIHSLIRSGEVVVLEKRPIKIGNIYAAAKKKAV